mgnify:CR=1 FL=1
MLFRSPPPMIDLRRFVGQLVKLTAVNSSGATVGRVRVQNCHLVAVPQAFDDPHRYLAVVETLDPQSGTIAIPTTRILGVTPLTDLKPIPTGSAEPAPAVGSLPR